MKIWELKKCGHRCPEWRSCKLVGDQIESNTGREFPVTCPLKDHPDWNMTEQILEAQDNTFTNIRFLEAIKDNIVAGINGDPEAFNHALGMTKNLINELEEKYENLKVTEAKRRAVD
ncbi:hypothetical protein HRM2_44760 [Desulforapulum autotrophicum HRM2]|uniref:Uncharacterized protein n=1 Tax=Desulforapulum autotrophicum (strain ATCC 43914 / DSM 3382 / VKM B-1955 / HRM2) TaxID=177437 RepID=C0QF31_DESAH|nr:hypothetical protein [Desulforapulum autotrophicum]ACN17532.1 hypothetical protein HRM2_44760 [Desulforapulum autotrophicum HRM2]